MVLLVTPDKVKYRMALPEDMSADAAIESAVQTAQNYIGAVLDTDFSEVTGEQALFFLDNEDGMHTSNKKFRLRLPQALITEGSVSVFTGDEENSTTTVVPSSSYRIDYEKGIVYVSDDYQDTYIKVVYSAGFNDSSTPPSWLEDAVLLLVPSVINNTQITNRTDELNTVIAANNHQLSSLLERRMRGRAFQTYPIP